MAQTMPGVEGFEVHDETHWTANVKIPLGLGARHAAAAGITSSTNCIALAVSQSSGAVRLFKGGNILLELHQTARRI